MKKLILAVMVSVACGMLGSSAAQAEDAAMVPVHQFIDSLNAGNVKAAASTHLSNVPIIDEFAPYHWTSFDAWLKAFAANNKKHKVTDVRVTLSATGASPPGPGRNNRCHPARAFGGRIYLQVGGFCVAAHALRRPPMRDMLTPLPAAKMG
ncbi:MAG: hypothetical protein J0H79_04395 [Alphaproteobacteria bacterium]|nr:hypothetical protein [Alphaproteobacteria bacterium]